MANAFDTNEPAVSANLSDERVAAPIHMAAEPIYFASGDRHLFGWLHSRTEAATRSIGLVICNPFGFEAMSAHLSIRAFAESAANLGIPALRFDYSGAGDSEDLPPAADQWDAWIQDVLAAIGNQVQPVGSFHHEMMKGDAPLLTPEFVLETTKHHAVPWWLTTEDLPAPENRVTIQNTTPLSVEAEPARGAGRSPLW